MRFIPPEIDDLEVLDLLPVELAEYLREVNGFIRYDGGLHMRGAVLEPGWHSIREAWAGDLALSRSYSTLSSDDVPFAQDALGDQFLLRDSTVFKLYAEIGTLENLNVDLSEFLRQADDDPIEYLELQPLRDYLDSGRTLEPGQLLNVYPPFCSVESADGVTCSAVAAEDRLRFLQQLVAQIGDLRDGAKMKFRVVDDD
jgi:hypothetical protein